ncbi:hypothetical protein DOY81_014831, partial [Sarcophaga bullata]
EMNEQNGHISLNAGDTVLDIPTTNNNIDVAFAGVNNYFNKNAQQEKIEVIDIG